MTEPQRCGGCRHWTRTAPAMGECAALQMSVHPYEGSGCPEWKPEETEEDAPC